MLAAIALRAIDYWDQRHVFMAYARLVMKPDNSTPPTPDLLLLLRRRKSLYGVTSPGHPRAKAGVAARRRGGAADVRHINRIDMHSNENLKDALVVTCDVVVGLVLCKSSDGTRVDFLG